MKYGYKVDLDKNLEHSKRAEEEYGSWEDEYSNSFRGIRKTAKVDDYPDVLSDHDIADGDEVFVVWLEYSTGDSFGRSHRGSTETVGVFKDLASARDLALLLETSARKDVDTGDHYRLDHTTPDGQHFKLDYMPWVGYFESLEDVHVERTTVGKTSGKGWWR